MGRSWVDDLTRGFAAGSAIDERIDATAERRKKAKAASAVAGEMDSKLFNVEDKGPIGNFMWDKFGLGDAPKVTSKDGLPTAPTPAIPGTTGATAPQAKVAAGAPAGDTPSALRQAVGQGLTAASSMSGGGEAPAASAPPTSEFVWSPTAAPVFAAAAPSYAAPVGAFQELDAPAQRRRIMQDNPIV